MKVLLVDDHVLFREGVALLLRPLLPNMEILETGSCNEALERLNDHRDVALVLMELDLPGITGPDGIAMLRARFPETPVVALSSDDDHETVLRAVDSGAMGFIPKASPSDVLAGALKLALAGQVYLPPAVSRPAARANGGRLSRALATATKAGGTQPSALSLTPRQFDVLYLILQGMTLDAICRELSLSRRMVRSDTSIALRALDVTTRTQALIASSQLGLRFGSSPSG